MIYWISRDIRTRAWLASAVVDRSAKAKGILIRRLMIDEHERFALVKNQQRGAGVVDMSVGAEQAV